jgi:hypothetical protein
MQYRHAVENAVGTQLFYVGTVRISQKIMLGRKWCGYGGVLKWYSIILYILSKKRHEELPGYFGAEIL